MICPTCVYRLNCSKEHVDSANMKDQCEKFADKYYDTRDETHYNDPLPKNPLNDPWAFATIDDFKMCENCVHFIDDEEDEAENDVDERCELHEGVPIPCEDWEGY